MSPVSSPVHVVGPGEVGRRLGAALERAGREVRLVTRTAGWDEVVGIRDSPAILAMREDDLPAALGRFPDSRRPDLVLVQNGFLEPVLGPLDELTRGLVWFTAKGDFFRPLQPSLFHGRHADLVASALRTAGIPAEVIHDRAWFLKEMILKGAWNCVVGLPLAVRGMTLEDYLATRRDEASAVVAEACAAAGAEHGVEVPGEEALGRLLATAGPIGWMRGGTKALRWRNGAVAELGRRHGVATPVNDELLSEVE